MANINKTQSRYIEKHYVPMMERLLQLSFMHEDSKMISDGLRYSINKRLTAHDVDIVNDYTSTYVKSNTLELSDFIDAKKPIITPYGAMFQPHSTTSPNLISMILTKFLDRRNEFKAERKKYQKGSPEFMHYDLMQLLAKIDANSLYGVQGMHTSLFYNLYVAASITSTGQSAISASGLFFEMFLNNNVKYSSLDEILGMIDNVISEKGDRVYRDTDILDSAVDVDTCFAKVIMSCGFNWIPSEREMNIVYGIISELSQEDLNRLYYKNNLYEFIYNAKPRALITNILKNMHDPMIFPTHPPENVSDDIDEFCNLLGEYVYYGHQIVDRLDKYSNMIRSVAIITDTDSVIVSLDRWYRFILELTKDEDLPLRCTMIDEAAACEGEIDKTKTFKHTDDSEEAIKTSRTIAPDKISPQECLRYSILNILAYCLDRFINDYMVAYVKSCNALSDEVGCLMVMKNEFLFKRALVTDKKKNYATIQELQEGTIIPKSKSLDIKGLTINKSVLNTTTRDRLKYILKEYVLDIDEEDFSQAKVIQEIKKFENEIYQSLVKGDRYYYKPVKIKPIASYKDPFSIQGIKAAYIYNIIKDKHADLIDLDDMNRLELVKVNINKKNIVEAKDKIDEDTYNEIIEVLDKPPFDKGITTIASDEDFELPKWIFDFIDYKTIIADNLQNFPLEPLKINRGRSTNPYTNILNF